MTDAKESLIWTDVDYERSGKQVGWLSLPHSVTRSAYGVIRIPVCVVKNGLGPTVLLQAGNHGDEYEGQIALTRFIRGVGRARCRVGSSSCRRRNCRRRRPGRGCRRWTAGT